MIIQSSKVWLDDKWQKAQIEVENNTIKRIHPYNKYPCHDYGSKRIIPGFIDCHTHGAYGFDTNDAKPEGLRNWAKNIVQEGVTSFCPTTITQSQEVLTNALKNVADVMESDYKGANILGVHFEGPYLDSTYKGAQPEKYCVKPNVEQFKQYEKASRDHIKIITMACEHDIGFDLTEYCVSKGIVVSQGHSSATFDQAKWAIDHGAKSMTHVYNGMKGFHHRDGGLVGAAFHFKDVYGEIIGDLNHCTKEALSTFYDLKDDDHAILITDSLKVKGLKPGTKTLFGGNEIELYEDGSAHLVEGGNLAGSTLKVNVGLKNLVEIAGIDWIKAIHSCTINPARMLGVDDRKGSIEEGKDADIVVLDDDYSIIDVFVNGIKQ